jgi:hypothetical protein
MDISLAKISKGDKIGLVPADTDAEEVIAKLADGEISLWRPMRVRSVPWHRLYFGICRQIGKNQDPQRDENSIDAELRILAGHYDVLYIGKNVLATRLAAIFKLLWRAMPPSLRSECDQILALLDRGQEVRVPKRIAFDRLTADEWGELFPSLELAIRERFGEEYIENIDSQARGAA